MFDVRCSPGIQRWTLNVRCSMFARYSALDVECSMFNVRPAYFRGAGPLSAMKTGPWARWSVQDSSQLTRSLTRGGTEARPASVAGRSCWCPTVNSASTRPCGSPPPCLPFRCTYQNQPRCTGRLPAGRSMCSRMPNDRPASSCFDHDRRDGHRRQEVAVRCSRPSHSIVMHCHIAVSQLATCRREFP